MEFDTNPIEEMGLAKNTISRTLEAYQSQMPIECLVVLKLAYHGLDAVQQWFYRN